MSAAALTAHKGPLAVGDQFLKYEIHALLGQGGHGWVYHGYDPFLDRHVAIKVIPQPDRSRDLQRRAQLEARVLCKLQHRNVVHVIDAGASGEGAVYIVMELLHGRTLRDAIRDYRQLSVAEVLSLGAQIADGVQAAHEQNAIHRDLKPENVFVQQENAIKVLDFGIAKFLGSGAATTQKDLFNGTILYMSPEHLQGFGVSPRSDIYALGTTLYEALAGRPPCLIGMEEPTLESVTFAQINRKPTPLDVLTGTVPRFVARAVQRMLAKEPVDRFATMAEVSRVLRAHLQRFVSEFPDSAAASQRELWRGTCSISPASGAIRSNQATTDGHELGTTTTSPTVAARPSLATDTATPLQFSPDLAVRATFPSQTPRLPSASLPRSAPVPSSTAAWLQAPIPSPRLEAAPALARAEPALARAEPALARAEPALARVEPTLVLASITLPQLLLSAVVLGTLVGLAIGLIQGLPRSQPTPMTRSENAQRSVLPPVRPESTATPAAQAAVLPEAGNAPGESVSTSASHPPVATSALHPAIATVRPPASPKLRPKAINSGPASGLEAETGLAKKGKVAAPASSSSAPPIRRPRAIYGSDDDDGVTR